MNNIEKEILEKYLSYKPFLNLWGKKVDDELNNISKLIDDPKAIQIKASYRLKDDTSFLSKAIYREKKYSDPFLEIEDKIGTRIVVLKSTDILVLKKLILANSNWNAKVSKDIEQEIFYGPKLFDYQSLHIIVNPKSSDLEFHNCDLDILKCEIQVRTLLQHSFAEISHDSVYKGPYKNDKEIIRHLSKSMALMEATDDYFIEIFKLMTDEKRKYKLVLDHLTSIFKEIRTDFINEYIDHSITDYIFELLDNEWVEIEDLDSFMRENSSEMSDVILSKNQLIFQQPIIILVAYYLFNHPTLIKEKWPLDESILKSIFLAFGISYESY